MNKYLVLYKSEGALNVPGMSVSEMMANTPPERMAAGMALWQAWLGKCGSALLDPGAPLDKSTTVAAGAGTPGKTDITGYTLLQAESVEAAAALMADHPHFHTPGGSIQILECVRLPGM